MGRKKLPKSEKKSFRIFGSITKKQFYEVKEKADKLDLRISAFLRKLLYDNKIIT